MNVHKSAFSHVVCSLGRFASIREPSHAHCGRWTGYAGKSCDARSYFLINFGYCLGLFFLRTAMHCQFSITELGTYLFLTILAHLQDAKTRRAIKLFDEQWKSMGMHSCLHIVHSELLGHLSLLGSECELVFFLQNYALFVLFQSSNARRKSNMNFRQMCCWLFTNPNQCTFRCSAKRRKNCEPTFRCRNADCKHKQQNHVDFIHFYHFAWKQQFSTVHQKSMTTSFQVERKFSSKVFLRSVSTKSQREFMFRVP